MENKKINIAELLKRCPQGMDLDCTMYEDCKFLDVDAFQEENFFSNSYLIRISTPCGIKYLDKYGRYNSDDKAKCVIFPTGKTTWEGFIPPCKFKDGDIISNGRCICIYNGNNDNNYYGFYVGLGNIDFPNYFIDTPQNSYFTKEEGTHLATEEEKRKLFDAIKENGYRWNEETKNLEKLIVPKFKIGDKIRMKNSKNIISTVTEINNDGSICVNGYSWVIRYELQDKFELVPDEIEPKFKVGDVIKDKVGHNVEIIQVNIDDECYEYITKASGIGSILFKEQDDWELVSNKNEPKFKVGDKIKTNEYEYIIVEIKDYHYLTECGNKILIKNQDYFNLVPDKFDISTLVPFESKVLVRNRDTDIWRPAIFGGYIDERNQYKYMVIGGLSYECLIPYEGNEHLRGKDTDCDEHYKTWEE